MARERPDDPSLEQRPQKRPKRSPEDESAVPPPSNTTSLPFTHAQYKFALAATRTLKKHKLAGPFLLPVDPIALNIPHYTQIITKPMDLTSIDRKLLATTINKAENMDGATPGYRTIDEWIADVKLIFQNTFTFNGLEHDVSKFARKLEDAFEKLLKKMPTGDEEATSSMSPPAHQSITAGQTSSNPLKLVIPRRGSNATANGTPAIEIDPSIPSQLPSPASAGPTSTQGQKGIPRKKDDIGGDLVASQLRFCGKILDELYKPQYQEFAWWFYDPVDPVVIPTYLEIIKRPMDLRTMRGKLESGQYPGPSAFQADFKQIITNCNTFNPPGSVAQDAARKLKELFERKWKALPKPKAGSAAPARRESGPTNNGEKSAKLSVNAATPSAAPSPGPVPSPNPDTPPQPPVPRSISLQPRPSPAPPPVQPLTVPKPSSSALTQPPTTSSTAGAGSSSTTNKAQTLQNSIRPPRNEPALSLPSEVGTSDSVSAKLGPQEQKKLVRAIQSLTGPDLEKAIQWIVEGTSGVQRMRDQSGDDVFAINSLPDALVQRLYAAFVTVRPTRGLPRPKTGNRPSTFDTGRSVLEAQKRAAARNDQEMNVSWDDMETDE